MELIRGYLLLLKDEVSVAFSIQPNCAYEEVNITCLEVYLVGQCDMNGAPKNTNLL